jgi:hypothetical protein
MTRTDIETLTREELIELAIDLDRRNRKGAQLLEVGVGQGLIPVTDTIRTLRGSDR